MLSAAAAIVIGSILGVVVHILSVRLPQYRIEDEIEHQDTESDPDASLFTASAVDRPNTWRIVITALVLGALSYVLFDTYGLNLQFAVLLIYMSLFVLIAIIDIEHRLILNIVMLPAFIFALIEVSVTDRLHIADGLVGFAVGQIVVTGMFLLGDLYLRVVNRKRDDPVREIAFGMGDVTLATFCGLVVGYPEVIYMLIVMIVVGGVMAFVYLIGNAVTTGKYQAHMAMPYGPAVVIAAALMLLWGEEIIQRIL